MNYTREIHALTICKGASHFYLYLLFKLYVNVMWCFQIFDHPDQPNREPDIKVFSSIFGASAEEITYILVCQIYSIFVKHASSSL